MLPKRHQVPSEQFPSLEPYRALPPIPQGNVTNSYGDWDVGEFIHKRKMDFFQGNIVKYTDRHERKDGKRDLLKARDYIDKLIELKYGN
jgi:hypothetical protein